MAEPAEYIPAPEVPLVYALEQPKKPVIPDGVLCNCWAYVRTQVSIPSTKEVLSNLQTSGEVIVFYYADVGLHHYAVVREVTEDGYLIEETNYKRCQHGTRFVPKADPAIIGFFSTGD